MITLGYSSLPHRYPRIDPHLSRRYCLLADLVARPPCHPFARDVTRYVLRLCEGLLQSFWRGSSNLKRAVISGNVHRSRHSLNADTIREMHRAFRKGGRAAINKVMKRGLRCSLSCWFC